MFYDAMARKGWKPSANDMEHVVKIHNAVNEKAWAHVMAWERRHCDSCPDPKLLKFRGRPKDYSPKARFLNFLGYKLPFDRHDWVVDRCGTEVRYVIDFYNAVSYGGVAPVAMHLDVRPARFSLVGDGSTRPATRMDVVRRMGEETESETRERRGNLEY